MAKHKMKSRIQLLTVGIAANLALLANTQAATFLTIDNFTVPTPTQSVSDNTGVLQTSNQTGLGANTISGERTITVIRTGGTGTVESRVDQSGQTFNVDAGSGTTGVGTIEWNIGSATDLTAGGATAFEFNVTNNDQGATVEIEVESAAGTSTFSSGLISAGTVGLFTAFFTDFTGSAVFTGITRLKITVTNQSDTDFAMRAFFTSQPQDYGDAPDTGTSPNGSGTNSYCTTLANNGPRHIINTDMSGNIIGPLLGTTNENVDAESDGLQSATANGDDTGQDPANAINDETGVNGFSLVAGDSTSSFDIHVTGATGFVNAWIDFNGDGDFADAGEQVLTNDSRTVGSHTITLTPPFNANLGNTFMRVRISTAALTGSDTFKSASGPAADGEVEDHQVNITAEDWGDAPDSFNTTSVGNGPSHPYTAADTRLGATVDSEGDGNPSTGADGDDTTSSDDEDGVTGIPAVVTTAGGVFSIDIDVQNANGNLTAWADTNQNGAFEFGEQFIGPLSAPAVAPLHAVGTHSRTLNIPAVSTSSPQTGDKIYLRFRIVNSTETAIVFPNSSSTALTGEVEDYVITVVNQFADFGDNPDTYTTTAGPNHLMATASTANGPILGASIDADPAGQPTATSNGDDADGNDDEDGVSFPTMTLGTTANVSITTSGGTGRFLNGWIDWNGDGDYQDAQEHVLDNVSVSAGATGHNISIPATATAGNTHARFRVTETASVISAATRFTGQETTGEVEDYQITLVAALDFGDAPDTYGTLLASNGPRHSITGPSLVSVDAENDGVPTSTANGDDTAGSDDEETVIPACLDLGASTNITFTVANGPGKVSTWIDLNGDGDFLDASEMVMNNVLLPTGANVQGIAIPATASIGASFMRIRIISDSDPNLTSPLGAAASGEVEDHPVTLCADFGDAPDTYCTTIASVGGTGASHAATGPSFGTRDTEANGVPTAAANGDDVAGSADEDTVSFTPAAGFDINGTTANSISFTVTNGPGDVEVFVDWNIDGDFLDANERYDFDGLASGPHTQSISVPAGTSATGTSYVRLRIYSPGTSLNDPCNHSPAGEVQDHQITISNTTFVDLLSFDAAVTDSNEVAINWVTGSEIDSAGFNILRARQSDDATQSYAFDRINNGLIPAQGTSVEGASYGFTDSPGYGTFVYQLEDVELSGIASLHPFSVVTIEPTLNVQLGEEGVALDYVTIPGWNYEIEVIDINDPDSSWEALPGAPHNAGELTDTVVEGDSSRLYRLKATQAE